MTSRLVQSKKLVITLFVSSITIVFFSLNLAIKVGSNSLQQGSNSCLKPFAKLLQALMDVYDTTILESPIIFFNNFATPMKSPPLIFGTLLSLINSSKNSFFSFQDLASETLSYHSLEPYLVSKSTAS
jgi:hypothetical protein